MERVKNVDDLKFNRENTCPLCGSNSIDYDASESSDNCMWYPCTCEDCGATWQEVYEVTFNQVDEVVDKDGNTVYSSFN